jgi:beta-carotene 15,15'-dioxygenase
MPKIALIFFIAFELCYYLLIAQTGIVEYFSSNIMLIAPLPIGGIVGSLLSYGIKISSKNKIKLFLGLQLLSSFFYPQLSVLLLFILGLSVGALAPLLIHELKKATPIQLGFALSISYSVGTFLFNYEAALRGNLAIFLTSMVLAASFFLPKEDNKSLVFYSHQEYSLFVMSLWVFLDSTLFETLSRDISISIWRDGYSLEIALFHILGVVCALYFKIEKNQKELFIMLLFALSYLFYFVHEALILSILYPFVISFYNVVILQTLIKKDLKILSMSMIFIGWVASGSGLFVALENLTLFVPIFFLMAFIKILNNQQIQHKETTCLN